MEIMAEGWPQQDGVNESQYVQFVVGGMWWWAVDWLRSQSDTTTGAVMIARD